MPAALRFHHALYTLWAAGRGPGGALPGDIEVLPPHGGEAPPDPVRLRATLPRLRALLARPAGPALLSLWGKFAVALLQGPQGLGGARGPGFGESEDTRGPVTGPQPRGTPPRPALDLPLAGSLLFELIHACATEIRGSPDVPISSLATTGVLRLLVAEVSRLLERGHAEQGGHPTPERGEGDCSILAAILCAGAQAALPAFSAFSASSAPSAAVFSSSAAAQPGGTDARHWPVPRSGLFEADALGALSPEGPPPLQERRGFDELLRLYSALVGRVGAVFSEFPVAPEGALNSLSASSVSRDAGADRGAESRLWLLIAGVIGGLSIDTPARARAVFLAELFACERIQRLDNCDIQEYCRAAGRLHASLSTAGFSQVFEAERRLLDRFLTPSSPLWDSGVWVRLPGDITGSALLGSWREGAPGSGDFGYEDGDDGDRGDDGGRARSTPTLGTAAGDVDALVSAKLDPQRFTEPLLFRRAAMQFCLDLFKGRIGGGEGYQDQRDRGDRGAQASPSDQLVPYGQTSVPCELGASLHACKTIWNNTLNYSRALANRGAPSGPDSPERLLADVVYHTVLAVDPCCLQQAATIPLRRFAERMQVLCGGTGPPPRPAELAGFLVAVPALIRGFIRGAKEAQGDPSDAAVRRARLRRDASVGAALKLVQTAWDCAGALGLRNAFCLEVACPLAGELCGLICQEVAGVEGFEEGCAIGQTHQETQAAREAEALAPLLQFLGEIRLADAILEAIVAGAGCEVPHSVCAFLQALSRTKASVRESEGAWRLAVYLASRSSAAGASEEVKSAFSDMCLILAYLGGGAGEGAAETGRTERSGANTLASPVFHRIPNFCLYLDRACFTVDHSLSFPFDYALLEAAGSGSSLRRLRSLYDSVLSVAQGLAAARNSMTGGSGVPNSRTGAASEPRQRCLEVRAPYTSGEAAYLRSAILYYILAFGTVPDPLPVGVSLAAGAAEVLEASERGFGMPLPPRTSSVSAASPARLASLTPLAPLAAEILYELQAEAGAGGEAGGERARLQMMGECLILRAARGAPGFCGDASLLSAKVVVMPFPKAANRQELDTRLAAAEVPLLSGLLSADRAACGMANRLCNSVLSRLALKAYISAAFSLEDVYLYARYGERYQPYLRFLALSAQAIGAAVALDATADPMEEVLSYLAAVHGEVVEGRRARRGQLTLSPLDKGERAPRASRGEAEARLALAGLEYLVALRAEYRAANRPALPAIQAYAAASLAPEVAGARLGLCTGTREAHALETLRQTAKVLAAAWGREPGALESQTSRQEPFAPAALALLDECALHHPGLFPRALQLVLRLYGSAPREGQAQGPLALHPHLPEDVALSCARAIARGELQSQGGMLILGRLPERRAAPCSAGDEELQLSTRPAHAWMVDELEGGGAPASQPTDWSREVLRGFLDGPRSQGMRQSVRDALEEVRVLIPGL